MMMKETAKFNIGECVIHIKQGYRAVIIDVDPIFQASGRINPQAHKHEFATRNPWYRLLVDGYSQMTYVEESLLKIDPRQLVINNPKIKDFLNEESLGHYSANVSLH